MRIVQLSVLLVFLPLVVAAEEYLPTPYTAEQIRDAWVEGFELMTRKRSAGGETYTLTRVFAATEDRFSMYEVEVDKNGRPKTQGQKARYNGTWVELRDHARFPAARASRERAEWDTPLGNLEGWLYRVEGEGGMTEFFFADDLPGPPVVYRRQGDGLDGFVAEQVSRRVLPE